MVRVFRKISGSALEFSLYRAVRGLSEQAEASYFPQRSGCPWLAITGEIHRVLRFFPPQLSPQALWWLLEAR